VRALIQFHRWLGAFRRITTSGNYIPEIDGLRLIAIGVVVIYHLGMWVQLLNGRHVGLFELGARGVELFITQFSDFGTPETLQLFMQEVAPAVSGPT